MQSSAYQEKQLDNLKLQIDRLVNLWQQQSQRNLYPQYLVSSGLTVAVSGVSGSPYLPTKIFESNFGIEKTLKEEKAETLRRFMKIAGI